MSESTALVPPPPRSRFAIIAMVAAGLGACLAFAGLVPVFDETRLLWGLALPAVLLLAALALGVISLIRERPQRTLAWIAVVLVGGVATVISTFYAAAILLALFFWVGFGGPWHLQ